MKRILFPLAFVFGLVAATLAGTQATAHPVAIMHIDIVHTNIMHID